MPPIGAKGIGAKRVGVIGAGMVGVGAASWLQRDGHSIFLIEQDEPGRGASFGNAGCFKGSSVTPVAMPGVAWSVPGWLLDPLAPLALRWSYLPALAPWLLRFIRAGTPEKARAAARALRPLVGPTLEALQPLVSAAGADDLVHRLGHLYVYPSGRKPGEGSLRAGSAARERGRDRRVRRRRIAPAGARPVARLRARRAGPRERAYLEPAGIGRAPRRAIRALGRRAGAGAGARLSPRRRPARGDRDRHRRPRCRRRDRLRRGLFET